MAARDRATVMSLTAPPSDDDLLRALLSVHPLCSRGPIIGFLADLASLAEPDERAPLRALLIGLFRRVDHTPPGPRFAEYRPSSPGEPARYAAYGANLLLLILCVSATVRASELFEGEPEVTEPWHDQALLWRSQLTNEGWSSLVDTVTLDRLWHGTRRDIRLGIGGSEDVPVVDLYWTLDIPPESTRRLADVPINHHLHPDMLRKKAWFQCSIQDDLVQHALEPLSQAIGHSVSTLLPSADGELLAAAHVLLRLWVEPTPQAYRRAAKALQQAPLADGHRLFALLLRHRLRGDAGVDATTAAHVIEVLRELGYADDM
ncbi:hypothetical protein ACTI_55840 [Actinoplanes sp. OR16]|uniref:hypothetical protein n=1 Tax=Actinoplanes sp. OR16 TaxID=946334 RepID=UPI000F70AD88|nr:hypothetical protein [Actinoplanes sp. OR16]BBH68899.1 hypothetical protein ACTI_55840 [Actinoplanes sp. OR16]